MELKPGYKQTEVGVIPEEWEAIKAGGIGRFRGGNGFPTRFQGETSGAYPFFKVSDMNNEGNETFMAAANNWITEATRKQLGATVFPADSIVFAKVGAAIFLERKRILAQPSCIDNNMAAFVLDEGRADCRFIHSLLLIKKLGTLVATTALPSLNGERLSQITLGLPSLTEQRVIAAALSDVDALLGALEKLIAKKRDLKQSAMQQLLTRNCRLPGFHDEWEAKPIWRFSGFVTKGATPTTYGYKWEDDGVLFLRSECVSESGLDLTRSMFISNATHAALIRGEVRSGDLLLTITGNVGRVVLLKADFGVANINQHIARIRVNQPNVSSTFVFHYLSQPKVRTYYGSITTGQAYPQISLRQVRETLVPLPSLAEQCAIASVLSDMDTEIAALEARRDKTRALKQGMLQELLTGRVRLV